MAMHGAMMSPIGNKVHGESTGNIDIHAINYSQTR